MIVKTSHFPILEALQVSPVIIYNLLDHGVEAERVKYETFKIIDSPEVLKIYRNILQGERVLCFMQRGIRADKSLYNI